MNKEFSLRKIRGDVLKIARELKGLTIEELAIEVCLGKNHISQVEDGDEYHYFYNPKIKLVAVKKIASYLELQESDYLE
jgi:transcriptional regulator with XRE-family HTH domain